MLRSRHSDQIQRAKQAIDLIYQLHDKAKALTAASEDPAGGWSPFKTG